MRTICKQNQAICGIVRNGEELRNEEESAFQAEYEGSIPFTRSNPQLNATADLAWNSSRAPPPAPG